MDKATFGNTQAALNLVGNILPDYPLLKKKVSSLLSVYLGDTAMLMYIPDKKVRRQALLLWRNHLLKYLLTKEFPLVVRTHVSNLIIGRYRQLLREAEQDGI